MEEKEGEHQTGYWQFRWRTEHFKKDVISKWIRLIYRLGEDGQD